LKRRATRFSQAIDEIVEVRVCSGIQFRTADVQGRRIGTQVAKYRDAHYSRPVRGQAKR
jgi:hypothetical protein